MNSWFGVIFLILILLVIYYLIGSSLSNIFCPVGSRRTGLVCCVYGFLLCQILFSLIEVPMACYEQPLSLVTLIWGIVLIVLVLASIILAVKKKMYLEVINSQIITCLKSDSLCWIAIIGIITVQIGFHVLNGHYGSYLDSSTYNGWIITALHTDTIFQYNPHTGLIGEIGKTRFLASYEMYAAAICAMTKMHPLIFINQVMSILEIIFYNVICLEIFKILFSDKIKNIVWALGFLCTFNLATSSATGTPASFLFLRTAESKSMLANIILPMIILEMCYLYFDEIKGMWWIFLFVILFAGCAIGNSGIFVPPVAAILGLISLFLVKNKPLKVLFYFPIIFIPNICYLALYFLWR